MTITRALFLVLGLLAAVGSAAAADGRALVVAGQVMIERTAPGAFSITALAAGAEIRGGDLIRTGSDGRVQLRFSDGSIVSLQPGTDFRVDEYRFEPNERRAFFFLVRGALRTVTGAIGKTSHDEYRMKTPTATVGVRGTEYVAEQTICDPRCAPGPRAGLRVAVSQGRIVLLTNSGELEVGTGQAAAAESADAPPLPAERGPVLPPISQSPPRESTTGRTTAGSAAVTTAGAAEPAPATKALPRGATTPQPTATPSGRNDAGTGEQERREPDERGASGAEATDPVVSSEASSSSDTWPRFVATEAGLPAAGVSPNERRGSGGALLPVTDRLAPSPQPGASAGEGGSVPSDGSAGPGSDSGASGGAGAGNGGSGGNGSSGAGSGNAGSGSGGSSGADSGSGGSGSGTGGAGNPSTGGNGGADNPATGGAGSGTGGAGNPATGGSGSDTGGAGNPSTGGNGSGTGGAGNPSTGGNGSGTGGSGNPSTGDTGSGTGGSGNPSTGGNGSGTGGAGNPSTGGNGSGTGGSGNASTGDTGSGTGGSGNPSTGDTGSGTGGSGNPSTGDTGSGTGGSGSTSGDGGTGTPDTSGTDPSPPEPPAPSSPTLTAGTHPLDPQAAPGSGPTLRVLDPWRLLPIGRGPQEGSLELDDQMRLSAFEWCRFDRLCRISKGGTRIEEAGHDAWTSWGRWTGGNARTLAILPLPIDGDQGLHYLVGVPSTTLPTSGVFGYELVGSTRATLSNGGPTGRFDGRAAVAFSPSEARVGIDASVAFPNAAYHFATPGGVEDPTRSPLATDATRAFRGEIATTGARAPLDCTAGCAAQVDGGLFGPDAARVGITYRITGSGGSPTISGVGVFGRKNPQP